MTGSSTARPETIKRDPDLDRIYKQVALPRPLPSRVVSAQCY